MRSFTRRGLASFALASVLVFAPLTATVAFADDEPVVENPVVEIVETPVVDTPAAETPIVEEPDGEPAESAAPEVADAGARAAAPAEDAAPIASRLAHAPMTLAASFDCDYTSVNYYGGQNNPSYYFPYCLDIVASTLHWNPTGMGYYNGYYISLTDSTLGTGVFSTRTSATSVELSLIPGHAYTLYADDGWSLWGNMTFTAPNLAPAAPAAITATRHATANAVDLSWTASAGEAINPVVSYTVDVTSSSSGLVSSTSVTTTEFAATGLVVGDDYTFAVTAVAENGDTSDATSTTATFEAIAPTAATNVVLGRTDETLSASWTAPTYDGGITPVEYWVELYADGEFLDSFSQNGTSVTLEEPAEFSVEYTLDVTARTDAGDAPTATSNAITRADSLPGIPTAYTDPYGYKDARVGVNWDLAPVQGSEVHTLSIVLYDAAGVEVDRQLIPLAGDRTGMDFTNLPNDTDFTVTIAAINDAGMSAESTPVAARTLSLAPPAYTAEELVTDSNFASITASLTGTTLTAHINGLAAGYWVYGYAHSTPTGLGWTQVDAAGNATWSISGAGLPSGAHTLAVLDSFGGHLGAAGFSIAAAAAPAALVRAGTDPSGYAAIAFAMLVLGVLATATKARRRAHA